MKKHHLHMTCASSFKQLSGIGDGRVVAPIQQLQSEKAKKHVSPLGNLMRLTYTASDFIDRGDHMTPTRSPRENISTKWREIHGQFNWENLLDPIHPWLRREIVKYGEFEQATYDAFDYDSFSDFCGSCRYNRHNLFDELHLTKHGYKVTKYIYAMTNIDVPSWFERPNTGETWSKDSNWMGYWRHLNGLKWLYRHVGTELKLDMSLSPYLKREFDLLGFHNLEVYLHLTDGFHDTQSKFRWNARRDYTASDLVDGPGYYMTPTRYLEENMSNKWHELHAGSSKWEHLLDPLHPWLRREIFSASEQVMEEVKNLVKFYGERGEEVSFTITGHSLGGALALLNAYEAAATLPDLPITVISFGAPQVGNIAFRDKIDEMKVRTLRIVVKQDKVPTLPENLNLDLNICFGTLFIFIYLHFDFFFFFFFFFFLNKKNSVAF
ncbi:unnamed protein product, partial [Vitis vinifera]|uniref:Fungal lipase-type domain-containing protein n=1 Tax=Vitis vinifera TaxID=29760 RepID=D7TKD6_VITVI